jgi:hypothetical protein
MFVHTTTAARKVLQEEMHRYNWNISSLFFLPHYDLWKRQHTITEFSCLGKVCKIKISTTLAVWTSKVKIRTTVLGSNQLLQIEMVCYIQTYSVGTFN